MLETKVVIGSVVEVEWADGARGVYRIGSRGESDPDARVIGVDRPMAAAIFGAAPGDIRGYWVRSGWRCVTVRTVHPETCSRG